MKYSSFQNTHS